MRNSASVKVGDVLGGAATLESFLQFLAIGRQDEDADAYVTRQDFADLRRALNIDIEQEVATAAVSFFA